MSTVNANTRTKAVSAHRQAIEADIHEIARYLKESLGSKLTLHIAKVSDPKTLAGWVSGAQSPRTDSERKLRAAYQVFHLLQEEDSSYVVRAWFIGMNPQLEQVAPADALRENRLRDVLLAAEAYLGGG